MSPSNDPTRREFLQTTAAVAGSLLTSAIPAAAEPAAAAAKQPNLVFFFGEGQRADAMSIAGHPILKTPHHDRIATEGVRFTNAFCTNALCAPARASALSGMYSRSTGALANLDAKEPMPADIPYFTDLLRKAGYAVAIVGKTHLRAGAEDRYWDYYFGHNNPGNNYQNPIFKEGRDGKIGPQQTFENIYPDDLSVDRALHWLDEPRGDKPFCLLVWFVAPHAPFYRPRRHLDLYNGVPIPKPATFDDDQKGYPGKPKWWAENQLNKIGTTVSTDTVRSLEELAKDYYAGLTAVDDLIGRVFSYLEQKNILDDTAILHGSDHGYFLGEWRLFDKRLMHEPALRVPLMVRYPKRIKPGTLRSEMALDIDIAPTLLDLAGVAAPSAMQGKSLLPVIKQPDPEFRKEWFYEYFEWPNPEGVHPHQGIRTERYKLIQYTIPPNECEMYDLHTDPGERNNLYGNPAHAALQADLISRMDKLQKNIPTRKGA